MCLLFHQHLPAFLSDKNSVFSLIYGQRTSFQLKLIPHFSHCLTGVTHNLRRHSIPKKISHQHDIHVELHTEGTHCQAKRNSDCARPRFPIIGPHD